MADQQLEEIRERLLRVLLTPVQQPGGKPDGWDTDLTKSVVDDFRYVLKNLDAETKRREAAEAVLNNLIEGGHISPVRWDWWQQVKAEKVVSDVGP